MAKLNVKGLKGLTCKWINRYSIFFMGNVAFSISEYTCEPFRTFSSQSVSVDWTRLEMNALSLRYN